MAKKSASQKRRRLELCRGVVQRVAVPGNAARLSYSPGVCLGDSSKLAVLTLTVGDVGGASVKISLAGCELQGGAAVDGAGDADSSLPPGPARIDWSSVPPSLDPAGEGDGGIGTTSRGVRKRWQVESVYCALCTLIDAMAPGSSGDEDCRLPLASNDCGEPEPEPRLRVVDFGSGSDNASLAVAWLLRKRCSFVLIDMKPVSANLASSRVDQVPGLATTVRCVIGRIEDYAEPFDVGIAVHACGLATDCAQLQCTAQRVPYLLVPCCVAKITNDVLDSQSRYAATAEQGTYASTRRRPKSSRVVHPSQLLFEKYREVGDAHGDGRAVAAGAPDCDVATGSSEAAPAAGEDKKLAAVQLRQGDQSIIEVPCVLAPRSSWLREQLFPGEWSAVVAVASHNGYDFSASGDAAVRRMGKTILEADRNEAAKELAGFHTLLGKLVPRAASPMNDVLIGWPSPWQGPAPFTTP